MTATLYESPEQGCKRAQECIEMLEEAGMPYEVQMHPDGSISVSTIVQDFPFGLGDYKQYGPHEIECRQCGTSFAYGEHRQYNLCDDCVPGLINSFPSDGEECGVCGGTIRYTHNRGYEMHYECDTCYQEWWYD